MPYHLWSQTQVFVAVHRNKVIGCVSLTGEGNALGMPMESTFGDIVSELRRSGKSFAEVCSLTVDSPNNVSTGEIFGQLVRLMMFYSRSLGIHQLVAVVHPRHSKFYQRAMGFETIGDSRSYQLVGGHPGVPILGDVNDRMRYRKRWQKLYFDGTYSRGELDPKPMGDAEIAYFRQYLPVPTAMPNRRAA
nr:hypothetical protein [Rhodopirellula sp. JC639]